MNKWMKGKNGVRITKNRHPKGHNFPEGLPWLEGPESPEGTWKCHINNIPKVIESKSLNFAALEW